MSDPCQVHRSVCVCFISSYLTRCGFSTCTRVKVFSWRRSLIWLPSVSHHLNIKAASHFFPLWLKSLLSYWFKDVAKNSALILLLVIPHMCTVESVFWPLGLLRSSAVRMMDSLHQLIKARELWNLWYSSFTGGGTVQKGERELLHHMCLHEAVFFPAACSPFLTMKSFPSDRNWGKSRCSQDEPSKPPHLKATSTPTVALHWIRTQFRHRSQVSFTQSHCPHLESERERRKGANYLNTIW